MAPRAAKKTEEVQLYPLQLRKIVVRLQGTTSLICNRFSDATKRIMIGEHTGEATQPKGPKDPETLWEESRHPVPGQSGKYGFPASGFKSALVGACTFMQGEVTKVFMRGALQVTGDILPIDGEMAKRIDFPKNKNGSPDSRYRYEFLEGWTVTVPVLYNASVITAEQIVNMFEAAGFHWGVGSWRPGAPESKNGNHGMFQVVGFGEDV